MVNLDPEVLLCRPVFQPISPQNVLGPEVILPPVQDIAFLLDELNEIPLCPILQFVQVLLKGSTTLRCISHTSQFCVICKLAEASLCLSVQVINEDIR